MRKVVLAVLAAGLVIGGALPAIGETVAEITRVRPERLEMVGFEITKPAEIDIEAIGLRRSRGNSLAAYAWILNTKTRELVWNMSERQSDRVGKDRGLRKAEKVTSLEAGKYELYYFASRNIYGDYVIRGARDIFDAIGDWFSPDDEDYYKSNEFEDLLRDCYVRVSSSDLGADEVKEFEVTGDIPGALLRLNKLGDNEYIRQAFTLSRDCNIRIYSIIELPRGNRTAVDHGWIVDAATGEKVWDMDRWGTERAGGGSKNRLFNDDVHLKKGEYILHFVTDDSHSWDDFNVDPPYDPLNWGITLLPGENYVNGAFALADMPEETAPVIDLTRARDNDNLEQPFRVKKETTVRIYALGEASYVDGELADYGWIEDASSGRIVWEMEYRDTDHAGGASKNRVFDGRITLEPGDYVAYYSTDDSHAYRDWNDSPPYDQAAWGMAIYLVRDEDKGNIEPIDRASLKRSTNLLVSITRVRSDERRREKFSLDRPTKVLIRALGEGQSGRMYDYGWIVDDRTGRTVWEMRYRMTDPAGGASKNRQCVDEVELDPGTYEVMYETDGSHAFNDWNARRPRNPEDWGITVSVAP